VQEVRRCKHGLDGTVRYLQHQLARERQISNHQTNAILALQMKRRDNCLHMLYLTYYVSCHTDDFLRNRAIWGSFWGTPSSRATVSNVLYLLPTSLWVWKITLTGSHIFSNSLNGTYNDDTITIMVGCFCVFFNWAVLVGCVVSYSLLFIFYFHLFPALVSESKTIMQYCFHIYSNHALFAIATNLSPLHRTAHDNYHKNHKRA